MYIRVSLHNAGGELDSARVELNEEDTDAQSHAIIDAIENWTLSPGDIIKIETHQ